MAATTKSDGFSAEESAAIKDRAQEVTAQAHGPDGAAAVTKIDKMPDDDKALATRFHQLVREVAPDLVPSHLVRHAGVCDLGQERLGGLLLPERGEDEDPLQHRRLQPRRLSR